MKIFLSETIESSFDPGEWLQAPGSLWFKCSYTCNMHYAWSIFYYFQHMPANHPTQQKQFSYISSPSLYFNPKDRDNESDISTFSKVTPKQSLKFNHSTPSPKNYKPVLHSPVKDVQHAWTSSTTVFPEAVSIYQELSPLLNQLFISEYLTRFISPLKSMIQQFSCFICLVVYSIYKDCFDWLIALRFFQHWLFSFIITILFNGGSCSLTWPLHIVTFMKKFSWLVYGV